MPGTYGLVVWGLVCSRSDSWSRSHSSSLVDMIQFQLGDEEANASARLEEQNPTCPVLQHPHTTGDSLWCQSCASRTWLAGSRELVVWSLILVEEAEQEPCHNLRGVLIIPGVIFQRNGLSW